MQPYRQLLIDRLDKLEESFRALAKRLSEAGELLERFGRPVPKKLLEEIADSGDQFDEIKTEVLRLSESVPGFVPNSELESIKDLRSLLDSLWEVIEYQEAQRAACGILETVLTLAHVQGVAFAPLIERQEQARALRRDITEAAWPNVHADAESLARGEHVFAEFVRLVKFHDQLEDEEWARLQELVGASFGKPLALAASRGKLTISAQSISEAPAVTAQPQGPHEPEEQRLPPDAMAPEGAQAVPGEGVHEDLHEGENSTLTSAANLRNLFRYRTQSN